MKFESLIRSIAKLKPIYIRIRLTVVKLGCVPAEFDSLSYMVVVAQWSSASGCEPENHGFESHLPPITTYRLKVGHHSDKVADSGSIPCRWTEVYTDLGKFGRGYPRRFAKSSVARLIGSNPILSAS